MKVYTAEEIFEVLQRVLIGERVLLVARSLKISESAINMWKIKYAGLNLEEIQNLIKEAKEKSSQGGLKPQNKIYPGFKFHRLTAIKFDKKVNDQVYWLFKCICGNEKSIRVNQVTSRGVKSCGCLVKEIRDKYKKREYIKNKALIVS